MDKMEEKPEGKAKKKRKARSDSGCEADRRAIVLAERGNSIRGPSNTFLAALWRQVENNMTRETQLNFVYTVQNFLLFFFLSVSEPPANIFLAAQPNDDYQVSLCVYMPAGRRTLLNALFFLWLVCRRKNTK